MKNMHGHASIMLKKISLEIPDFYLFFLTDEAF